MTDGTRRSVAESVALIGQAEFRITYEEQCAMVRSHHSVSISAKNKDPQDVIPDDAPIADECPVCGEMVISMSNQEVLD